MHELVILPPALSPTYVTDNCDMDTDSDSGPPAAPVVPMAVPASLDNRTSRLCILEDTQ